MFSGLDGDIITFNLPRMHKIFWILLILEIRGFGDFMDFLD